MSSGECVRHGQPHGFRGCGHDRFGLTGKKARNVVPRRGAFHFDPAPMLFEHPVDRGQPMPVPLPGPFVVKNGSKMRPIVASSIPLPVSLTVRQM